MHRNCLNLFHEYAVPWIPEGSRVLDVGSMDVNGSLRQLFDGREYVGLDIEKGDGVDVIAESPYTFPFQDGSFDAVVSANCAEHVEAVWDWVLELDRVTKDGGLVAISAPVAIHYHPYPVHCWAVRKDGWKYLFGAWMERNGRKAYDIIEAGEEGIDSFIVARKP